MIDAFEDMLSIMGKCTFGFTGENRVEVVYPAADGFDKGVFLSNNIRMSSYKNDDGTELPEFIIHTDHRRNVSIQVCRYESPFDKLCTSLIKLVNMKYYTPITQEQMMLDDFRKVKFYGGKENQLNESDKVYDLIAQADKCRKEIVLCLLGQPGIGKTEAVERYAEDHGRKVVHIIASQILPNEVSGITMPDRETHSMEIYDHYRLSHMRDGDILFFDELLQGQQQVLSACLTLIQERRLMSGAKLPDILIVAAANPLASPMQLRPEIRQRFMFVNVEWNPSKWVKYMLAKGFKGEKMIENLARIVAGKMKSTGDWNILTPRTATKLCEWMLSTEGNPAVRQYIDDTFGKDVTNVIDLIVGKTLDDEKKKKDVETFKSSIMDIIDEVTDGTEKEDAKKSVGDAIDRIVEKESYDMSELMVILMGMPEWPEISKALEGIEMPSEGIEY